MDEVLTREAHARIGGAVGKYRLEAVLGVGGTAAVYAATHRNGNRVAIKILHSQFAADGTMRERFLREGYVANKVDHPGTVRVLDDESIPEATYLVMELLDGETLEARSGRLGGVLPISDVVHHGIALLDVLEKAHSMGIVHRDMKPENVFFTTRQELKVLDFGIARLRDGKSQATKTLMGTMLGTPAYLAPEQALGHLDQIDPRTDLWATAATLFTLLTNRHVHQGRSPQEVLVFASTRPAPPLRSVAPHVPESLAHVIDRALRFRREERWQSASEMKRALLSTGLARITVAGARSGPVPVGAPSSRQAPTIMVSTAGARAGGSTSSFALAGALFGVVALGGIVGGLFLLKQRQVEPTFDTPAATSSIPTEEPEIEALPLPTATATEEPEIVPAPPLDVDAGGAAETPEVVAAPRPASLPAPSVAPAPSGDVFDPR